MCGHCICCKASRALTACFGNRTLEEEEEEGDEALYQALCFRKNQGGVDENQCFDINLPCIPIRQRIDFQMQYFKIYNNCQKHYVNIFAIWVNLQYAFSMLSRFN